MGGDNPKYRECDHWREQLRRQLREQLFLIGNVLLSDVLLSAR